MVLARNCKFKIGHLNVRSLFTGFDEFKNIVTIGEFDLMTVSETWLSNDISSSVVDIPGYSLYRRDRSRAGGGVGIYIKNELSAEVVLKEFCYVDSFEHLWIKVKLKKKHLVIGVVYRPPSSNLNLCIEHFEDILSTISPQFQNIIILGDLNVDHLCKNKVEDCFEAYDFIQLVREPTRITASSHKIIDVIYINNKQDVLSSGVLNGDLISDHDVVFCTLNFYVNRVEPKLVIYRDFRNINNEKFVLDLNNVPWDNIFYIKNVDEKVNFLSANILRLFDVHAPVKSAYVSKPYAPWLTTNIKAIMKERDKALEKFKKTKKVEDWTYYKKVRNFAVSVIRQEKKAYLFQQGKVADSNALWKALKKLNIYQKQQETPLTSFDANEINKYFLSVFSPNNHCTASVDNLIGKKHKEKSNFQLKLARIDEIQDIILSLKSNAVGSDGISAKMLHLCLPIISKYITHVVNCCLLDGYFPVGWKLALVRPLPKVKPPQLCSDLRPISILPTMSKILEKVVSSQLVDYLNSEGIIPCQQSGFRKGYSTTSALAAVIDDCIKAIDDNKATILTMLDFSKAFDTLDHRLLLGKMSYYGFNPTAVSFFEYYLTGRGQHVVVNNRLSDYGVITSGVPQGSILGPILFLLYTADLFKQATRSITRGFADDTQVYKHFLHTEIKQACDDVNHDLTVIAKYSSENNLKLNPDKSSVILLCNAKSRELLKSNTKIKLNDKNLTILNSVKNLGLIIDEDLRFKNHVNLIVKKSYIALKLLYQNYNILNFKLRKKLCEVFVLSHINYCLIVYYPCLDQITKNRLQKIQNSCCRFIFRLKKFDHVTKKIRELEWLKIDSLFQYHLSVFVFKIFLTSQPPYLRTKFKSRKSMHNVSLRHVLDLSMPRYNTSLFRRSFSYNVIKIFNSCNLFKTCKTVNSFRTKVKEYFLSFN